MDGLFEEREVLAVACWRRRPEVVARKIAGETVLVPVSGGLADLQQLYILNETGAAVWDRLDGNTDLAGVAAAVAEEYEVTLAQALADVRCLVQALAGGGLIEAAGVAPCAPA